jgi:hypothetical protein
MRHKIRNVPVEFIDKGTYVGSEEESFKQKMTDSDGEYVVITKRDLDYIHEQLFRLHELER